ncbi:iron-containing alcohol dehydrogenase, partial [Methylobacterium sp. WL103]
MTPFLFQTTPNLLFEAGAVAKIPDLVAGLGAKNVLLVTDRGVRAAGLTRG